MPQDDASDPEGRPLVTTAEPPAERAGDEVRLDPERACAYCGHVLKVAQVVRLKEGRYAYACVGCAVSTEGQG